MTLLGLVLLADYRATRRQALLGRCSGTSLELDAHHDAADARLAHLHERGCGEHASRADVKLCRQSILRSHRIALDGTGTALPGELHGLARECVRDTLSAKACAGDEAGDGPYAAVGLVLAPSFPGNAVVAEHARVSAARLDGTPADGFTVEVGDKAAGRVRVGVTAVCLRTEPEGVLRCAHVCPRLAGRHLEPLAPASRRITTPAEDGLEVVPACLVRRDDPRRGGRIGHTKQRSPSW